MNTVLILVSIFIFAVILTLIIPKENGHPKKCDCEQCVCLSKCSNPYAGFVTTNLALYLIGSSQKDECVKKCLKK